MSLTVILTLGIPMLVSSWFLFNHLLKTGDVSRGQVAEKLKAIHKRYKEDPKAESNPLMSRWMKFGGGFYGLTALYTFCMIEIADLGSFIIHFPGIPALLEDGLISLLLSAFINQVMNFVNAIIWFTWWGSSNQVFLNFVVAFLGYRAGMYAAENDIAEKLSDFREQKD